MAQLCAFCDIIIMCVKEPTGSICGFTGLVLGFLIIPESVGIGVKVGVPMGFFLTGMCGGIYLDRNYFGEHSKSVASVHPTKDGEEKGGDLEDGNDGCKNDSDAAKITLKNQKIFRSSERKTDEKTGGQGGGENFLER